MRDLIEAIRELAVFVRDPSANWLLVVVAAAIGGASGAAMRRLDSVKPDDTTARTLVRVVVGAVLTGLTSAALAAIGIDYFPNSPRTVFGFILLVSGVVDTSTDDGRAWVQREILGRCLAVFDAMRGARYTPPTEANRANVSPGTSPTSPSNPPGPTVPPKPTGPIPPPNGGKPTPPQNGGKPNKGTW